MKKISIPRQNWSTCWRNLLDEFPPVPKESSIKSVHKALKERYSIIGWYLDAENIENYIVFYTDEQLITFFVLKWS